MVLVLISRLSLQNNYVCCLLNFLKRSISIFCNLFPSRLHFKVFKMFAFIMKGIQIRDVAYGRYFFYKMFEAVIQINILAALWVAFTKNLQYLLELLIIKNWALKSTAEKKMPEIPINEYFPKKTSTAAWTVRGMHGRVRGFVSLAHTAESWAEELTAFCTNNELVNWMQTSHIVTSRMEILLEKILDNLVGFSFELKIF